MPNFDVIVLGLGAMRSAALKELALQQSLPDVVLDASLSLPRFAEGASNSDGEYNRSRSNCYSDAGGQSCRSGIQTSSVEQIVRDQEVAGSNFQEWLVS